MIEGVGADAVGVACNLYRGLVKLGKDDRLIAAARIAVFCSCLKNRMTTPPIRGINIIQESIPLIVCSVFDS